MREADNKQVTISVKQQEEIHKPDETIINSDNLWDYHKQLVNKVNNRENSVGSNTMPTELKLFLDQPLVDINTDPLDVSAIYRSACTAPRIFETQDEGQRQCMGLQYRKREQGKQCELRRLRR
jgi:hypothetical protein